MSKEDIFDDVYRAIIETIAVMERIHRREINEFECRTLENQRIIMEALQEIGGQDR